MDTLSMEPLSRDELKLLPQKERFEKWMETQISLMLFMQYIRERKNNEFKS